LKEVRELVDGPWISATLDELLTGERVQEPEPPIWSRASDALAHLALQASGPSALTSGQRVVRRNARRTRRGRPTTLDVGTGNNDDDARDLRPA
jgi:hypothetical protein